MGKHRAFGHRVGFRGNVSINLRNNLLRICRARPDGRQNVLLAFEAVRNVLVQLSVGRGNGGAVTAKQNREIWQ